MLPNAFGAPQAPLQTRQDALSGTQAMLQRAAELILNAPPGNWLENWEMRRKVRKFTTLSTGDESAFSADYCKGHFDSHGRRAMETYAAHWRSLGEQNLPRPKTNSP
jgi:hypothetical protein